MLPLTAATDGEVRAEGLRAAGRRTRQPLDAPLQIVALASGELDITDVSRGGEGDEEHLPLDMAQRLALAC